LQIHGSRHEENDGRPENADEQAVHAAHVAYAEREPGTGYVSNAECARSDSLAGAFARAGGLNSGEATLKIGSQRRDRASLRSATHPFGGRLLSPP
jgi:hypothetical protein